VPVIIHVLHRQRTVPVPWGAMQFLLESPLKFRRRKKVDHWLLLLARMALLALLALLLARPLLSEGRFNPLPGNAAADVAVVIDHSLSAGRKATAAEAAVPGQTVFDRALATVEAVAASMRPNDTLSVVLAEHRPDTTFTPLPVRSAGAKDVRDRLRQLKPGLTAADVPDAVQAARELLARGPNAQKVILLVTDAQRNAWQIDNAAAWNGALGDRSSASAPKVYCLPIAAEASARNVTVGELSIEPSVVGIKRPAQITATLTNTGAADVPALGATLFVGGREVTRQPTRVAVPDRGRLIDPATGRPRPGGSAADVLVSIPGVREGGRQSLADLKAGTSRTVRFDYTFTEAGSTWVQVRADLDDALKADDAAVAAVNVRQRLPVLVIDGQLTGAGNFRSSQFLVAAMQPVADEAQAQTTLIQPKVISASAADVEKLDDYAAVVVNDVPQLGAAALENLASYARSGHGVWVVLGPRSEPSLIGKQLASAGLFTAEINGAKSPQTPPGVELKTPQNPMVALVAAAERNAMTGAVTKRWWSVVPREGDEQVVLTAAGSGDPLVLERPVGRSGGRVVVWCTSADGTWNNWPLMPNFVPLVNETVYHLAGAGAASSERRRLEAGTPIEWSAGAEPRVKSATITRPDGKTVPRQPTLAGGRQRISYNDTAEPGLYTLRFDPTEVPQPVYFAVNLDRRELDPTTLTEADYAWLKSRGFVEGTIEPKQLASALGGATSGAELWRWLALAVLALLVFETVMTRRMIGLQAAPVEGAHHAAHAHV
jgi:hypothetical protein